MYDYFPRIVTSLFNAFNQISLVFTAYPLLSRRFIPYVCELIFVRQHLFIFVF